MYGFMFGHRLKGPTKVPVKVIAQCNQKGNAIGYKWDMRVDRMPHEQVKNSNIN